MNPVLHAVSSHVPSQHPVSLASSQGGRSHVDSRELLRGARELIIHHGDQEYRLRHTQNDKLILTK